jgi:pilus assembly protein CpaB
MRNKQAILFLALAVALGLAAALSAARWLESRTSESTSVSAPTAPLVVMRDSVPVGTALTDKHLGVVRWPERHVPKGAFPSVERAAGRVARRPLASGEPVLEAALLPEGSQGGLVAVIESRRRAISVKVDPVIGVAGFITPGAKVDVIATMRRIDLKKKLPYTKAVLQDVKVLAIDQKLEEARNGEPHLVSVVTLEVDPEQAEKLTYISHEGRLQLALRNPADREVVETRSTGVADLLPPRVPKRVRAAGTRVEIIRGSEVSTRRF